MVPRLRAKEMKDQQERRPHVAAGERGQWVPGTWKAFTLTFHLGTANLLADQISGPQSGTCGQTYHV